MASCITYVCGTLLTANGNIPLLNKIAGIAVVFNVLANLIFIPEYGAIACAWNAMLSFGYSLLRHDVQGALNIVGFDPYLGYLHTERYGRPSLALDLMEEFRPLIVDAIVLSAINRKAIAPKDFTSEPLSKAISLSNDARKVFLTLYEQKKQSEFKHPVMGRKCTYQEAFELQARLLAKYLMDETDKYPPLVMK